MIPMPIETPNAVPSAESVAKAIAEEIVTWFVQITDPERHRHLSRISQMLLPLYDRTKAAERKLAEAEREHAEWMKEHEQMFDRMNAVIADCHALREVVEKLPKTKEGE